MISQDINFNINNTNKTPDLHPGFKKLQTQKGFTMEKYNLEKATKEAMRKFNIKASKKYGQNFLINEKALEDMVNAAAINKNDFVLEIGPGLGTMTRLLCENVKKVIAIEIDEKMVNALRINMSEYKNLSLIKEDIMNIDLQTLFEKNFANNKCKVIANLPYYITSPIIMKLMEERTFIDTITLMVQNEVAQRIAASPGGKEYGILSIAVQYYSMPKIISKVPAASFLPKPAVDSAIIHLKIREKPPISIINEKLFFKVVRASFSKRRKTLLNSLNASELCIGKTDLEKILTRCEIDPIRRAETLTLQEFSLITNEIGLFLNK